MGEETWLAERFEQKRKHLRAVAYRLLGSENDADDAVQEAWLHLVRSDTDAVDNLGGWLTTVVARVSLDMLRARREHPQAPLPEDLAGAGGDDPEDQAVLADSVGLALQVVLDRLPPAERVAFVLHDVFAVPFEEIASVVGRSTVAARQLASRARRRVRGVAAVPEPEPDPMPRRASVDAFLAAAHGGDFAALLAILAPDVVVRADAQAVRMGAAAELRGAQAVIKTFLGKAEGAAAVLADGVPTAAWIVNGQARVVFALTITGGRIAAIDLIGSAERISRMDVVLLGQAAKGGGQGSAG